MTANQIQEVWVRRVPASTNYTKQNMKSAGWGQQTVLLSTSWTGSLACLASQRTLCEEIEGHYQVFTSL